MTEKMNERDRRAILFGAGALGAIAAVWFILLPWFSNWSETRDRIDQSRARLEELQERSRKLIALDRQLAPVLGDGVKHPMAGVEAARTQLIKDVMDVHNRSGAGVSNIQPESIRPVRELPGVVRLSVRVQSACPPTQLVQLLANARTSPDVLLLDRIDAAAPASPPGMPPGMGAPPGAPLTLTLVWSTLARQEGTP